MPFIIGVAFGYRHYWMFSTLLAGCMAVALTVSFASWRLARIFGQRSRRPAVESDLYPTTSNPAEALKQRLPSSGDMTKLLGS